VNMFTFAYPIFILPFTFLIKIIQTIQSPRRSSSLA
jgi:hypothetical protein